MTTIHLVLTVEETNLILRALGELPYREVREIVANVLAQAERQTFPRSSEPQSGPTVDGIGEP